MSDAEEATAARNYALGRLAVINMNARVITEMTDEAVVLFVDPEDDQRGKRREELMQAIDEAAGELATATQNAQAAFDVVDPTEGDDDDDDDDEGDDTDNEAE